MSHRTVEALLYPDGQVTLPKEDLTDHPVQVLVTILEGREDAALSDPGDYLERLAEYEDRLAQGAIRWQ